MLFKKIKIIFGIYILLSLFFYIFYVTPFEKPDEDLHFLRTVSVSRGNFICKADHNNKIVNLIPAEVYKYVKQFSKLTNKKIPIDSQQNIKYVGNNVNEIRSCVLPFFYYLIPATPISLLSKLNFSPAVIFYSGRLINTLTVLIILFFSLKNLPIIYQLISLYIFSWPMVLYQVSSYSKDAYFIALGLYIFNRFIHVVISKAVNRSELIIFIAAMILFVLARPQYLWFALFLLIILYIRSGKKSKIINTALILGTALTTLLVLLFLISHKVYLTPDNTNYSLSYYGQIDPGVQLRYIISHFLDFFITLFRTMTYFFNFYVKSAIGIFGALDKPLPNFVYVIYLVIGIVLSVILGFDRQINLFSRWKYILGLIIILTVITLFIAMYLYASPVGAPLIYAMQGRYFINMIPLLILLVAVIISEVKRIIK